MYKNFFHSIYLNNEKKKEFFLFDRSTVIIAVWINHYSNWENAYETELNTLKTFLCSDKGHGDWHEQLLYFSAANCLSSVSIDTSTLIGVIIGTSSFGFISMIVLVVTCICCVIKTTSKVPLHHPGLPQPVHEMETTDKKKITIEMKANSSYGYLNWTKEYLYY